MTILNRQRERLFPLPYLPLVLIALGIFVAGMVYYMSDEAFTAAKLFAWSFVALAAYGILSFFVPIYGPEMLEVIFNSREDMDKALEDYVIVNQRGYIYELYEKEGKDDGKIGL